MDETTPTRPGTRPQLFLDDVCIAESADLTRTLHSPEKVAECPIVEADEPWEQGSDHRFVTFNGTVIDDAEDGCFKMWYEAYPGLVCYAVSDDGIHWKKPILGVVSRDGTARNNIVLDTGRAGGTALSVIKDDADTDPMRRYKAMYGAAPVPLSPGSERTVPGASVAFSPDGIQWTPYVNNPAWPFRPYGPLDSMRTIYDPYRRRFASYDKIHRRVGGRLRRVIGLGESNDFIDWSEPRPVLLPDSDDPYDDDFYGLSVVAYEGLYVGYLWVFHTNPNDPRGTNMRMDGKTDVQLVSSRDGIHWHRVAERGVFIPLGEPGSYEAGQMATATNATPIVKDDRIYIFYSGLGGRMSIHSSGINLGTLRRDGYVSMDAATGEGVLETKPLVPCGERFLVNCDAAAGRLEVEVCGERGEPLDGFSREDCEPLPADEIRHQVRWKGGTNVAAAATGRPVRLRFFLANAQLYSFRFAV